MAVPTLAWLCCLVISGLKGKPALVTISIGILMMADVIGQVAGRGVIPAVVGAIRIARPDSRWARKFYGPDKMAIALKRFPTKV